MCIFLLMTHQYSDFLDDYLSKYSNLKRHCNSYKDLNEDQELATLALLLLSVGVEGLMLRIERGGSCIIGGLRASCIVGSRRLSGRVEAVAIRIESIGAGVVGVVRAHT